MPISLKQLQECWWEAGQWALNKRCVWPGASLKDPHFILGHMIMTHLSLTLDAAVIPNSFLPGQRKHLLLSVKCCNCVLIHKDRVSRWTLCESLDGPWVAPLRIFSLLSPPLQSGVSSRLCRHGGGERDLHPCFWKDVWNRSMGIKHLGSVGGLLCRRLSPLLASMISSIDIEAVLRSLFLFH